MGRFGSALILGLGGAVFCAMTAAGPPRFNIPAGTIDGGGGLLRLRRSFELSGTLGQPAADRLAGGPYELEGGFWFQIPAGDSNEDGLIGLSDHARFGACLTGPGAPRAAECASSDVNKSNTVDLADFAFIQNSYSGE